MVCGMSPQELDRFLLAALREDAPYGDRTTQALGLEGPGEGVLLAKENLIVCGLPAAFRVFTLADPGCAFHPMVEEGDEAEPGTGLAKITGPFAALLLAERTGLNLLQRMCGVATLTRRCVRALEGTSAKVLDTRKTTPGMRSLEKYAVRTGGGVNHRMGLSDGILIKDNHIAAAGSLERAVRSARERGGSLWRIEVEVKTMEEYRQALASGADVIMLDNMDDDRMAQAVALRPSGVLLEASGGMTLDRIGRVAALGVDFISMGALTHSARAVDISFELSPSP
jgi:nicotinate-nucleotide pyrophosphorylase (carboxylating)